MKMKKYISPTTEVVNVQARCSMLAGSDRPPTDWADAKPYNPSHNLWADEEEYSAPQEKSTNWAGYQKDMSLW